METKDKIIEKLQRENDYLKLQMKNKETIIRGIIKKLKIDPPFDNFINNLKRINFDYLIILDEKLK
jgi:hypothetical protein